MKEVYLFLLAAMVGIELSLGVLLAPILFHANELLGIQLLSRLQSGTLMSFAFIKFNYALVFVSVLALGMEGFYFFRKIDGFKKRFSRLMLAIIVLALSLLFVFYFSSYILEAARSAFANTNMQVFEKMHKASEYVLKLIMFGQLVLFFLSFNQAKKC